MHLIRLVLVVSVFLFLAAVARAVTLSPDQQLARDIYEELINIDTTHSSGNTTTAAAAVARRLTAAGFAAEDIQLLGPTAVKGGLVARLRGSGAKKPLLLLAHLDVVEAK